MLGSSWPREFEDAAHILAREILEYVNRAAHTDSDKARIQLVYERLFSDIQSKLSMLKPARRTNGFGMRFIIEDCLKEVIKTQTSSKLINGLGKGLKA